MSPPRLFLTCSSTRARTPGVSVQLIYSISGTGMMSSLGLIFSLDLFRWTGICWLYYSYYWFYYYRHSNNAWIYYRPAIARASTISPNSHHLE